MVKLKAWNKEEERIEDKIIDFSIVRRFSKCLQRIRYVIVYIINIYNLYII